MQREDKRVEMVGTGLKETVDRVEGMAGKRRRNLPGVVHLVQVLIHAAVMKQTVNPVDTGVGKRDEHKAAKAHP